MDADKRRQLRALRRVARGATPGSNAAGRLLADESAFWTAYERASTRSREAGDAAQAIATMIAKQRAAVDALADRARAVARRAQELSGVFARVNEVFDRLGLVALNAGLEGARLGEGTGRALLLVSDEVRTHALRGGESMRELSTTLGELGQELTQLHAGFEGPLGASGEMAQQAAVAAGAAADTERALVEIDARVRRTQGTDPETAKAITDAAERASALVRAVGELGDRVPPEMLLRVLRPMIEPLVRLVADAPEAEEEGGRGSEPPPSAKREEPSAT